jgi:acyl transferase domain-containing protein
MGSIHQTSNGVNNVESVSTMKQVDVQNGSDAVNDHGTKPAHTDVTPVVAPIAIVGMGMRLPGGVRSTEAFWELLLSQRDVSVEIPKDRFDVDAFYSSDRPRTVKTRRGFFLDGDFTAVDPAIWGSTPNQQGFRDPQQRLLLEVVWECMENAGQTGWRGRDIGVYVGTFGEDSLELSLKDSLSIDRTYVFGVNDFCLSNQISYDYDLRGPRYVQPKLEDKFGLMLTTGTV